MKKIVGFFIFIGILSFGRVFGSERPYMDSTKAAVLIEAQETLFNDRFDKADSIYNVYIKAYPDDPAGYFFKAAAMMSEMIDSEDELYNENYHDLLDKVEQLADRKLESDSPRTRAWMYLFKGHAAAYRALWESRYGSFISAIKNGLAAKDEYNEGLKTDSTLYDLYLGLGSYHYWKSAKAGMLRWLGIFKNEKDKGIEELNLTADSSLLFRESAHHALIWVWLDKKNYDSAIILARQAVEANPPSRTFRWPLAEAYFKAEKYQKALDTYKELRSRINRNPGNYYNLIECDYRIYECYDRLNQPDKATAYADVIFEYASEIPKDIRHKQRVKISRLKKIARR